ncbi:MAG: TraB/GumN family protein [Planctomycetia bacterium]|nr:TraB/GumN family protein [Planctomycetia bacterium]
MNSNLRTKNSRKPFSLFKAVLISISNLNRRLIPSCLVFLFVIWGTVPFPGHELWAFEPIPLDENGQPLLTEFVRLQCSPQKVPLSLDTSIIHYESTQSEYQDVSIDLIGAIHFAEESYYQSLNEHFKNYDIVLFEMVIPKNEKFSPQVISTKSEQSTGSSDSSLAEPSSKSSERKSPATQLSLKKIKTPLFFIGDLQLLLGKTLHLTAQLDGIDYSVPNLTHCDLDAETVYAQMFEKGDIQNIANESILHFFKPTDGMIEAVALTLLASKNRTQTLKRFIATEIYQSYSQEELTTEENAIITLRNELVLKKLKEEIQSGKKRIAIFYGAAHIPHFSHSLKKHFHFQAKSQCWLKAWDLSF